MGHGLGNLGRVCRRGRQGFHILGPGRPAKTTGYGHPQSKEVQPKTVVGQEDKEQRKAARRAGRNHREWRKEAAKLRNLIKRKKREHWASFVEETVSKKAQDI